MSNSQSRKGANGERELFALLSGELGAIVRRRVDASRGGGSDSLDLPGWAIEVKRAEPYLRSYWEQTAAQADAAKRRPVLFWRPSRAQWTAYVDLCDLAPSRFPPKAHEPARLSLLAWCQLARELM